MKLSILVFISFCLLTNVATAFDYLQVLPKTPLVPPDNLMNKAKIALGKRLFFDKNLSIDQGISCNGCHNLLTGGGDDQALSIGLNGGETKRSAPGLWNIGLQTVLYWDGRVKTLEAQVIDHLHNTLVSALNPQQLIKRLRQNGQYKVAFQQTFGHQSLTLTNFAKAIASFERSLMAYNSPFDRYLKGNKNAISSLAKAGIKTFNTVGCLACHFGVNLAGPAPGPAMGMGDGFYELFPNTRGTIYETQLGLLSDQGRYEFSKDPSEKYMWRVPPLRNIALTPPYFHNGSAKTLRQAVRVMGKTQFNKDLSEQQVDEITAFLRTLTGERPLVLKAGSR